MRKKNIKKKLEKYQWGCILTITVLVAMYVYGMTTHYFPNPIHLGAGQYIDIATGVIILAILFSSFIVAIIFKKKKKVKK